jgi:serine protease Do
MQRRIFAVAVLLAGIGTGGYLVGQSTQGDANKPPIQVPPRAVPQELNSYRDIVKKILPAVVSIESRTKLVAAKGKAKAPRSQLDDPRIPDEFRRFFEEFGRGPESSPNESPQLGFGSGFLIDPKGVILTNYHVVAGADNVVVTLNDGRKFTSTKIHGDQRTDLAIVQLDAKGTQFPWLELGDSDAAEIGDRVLAVGAPFGLTGSVTSGIVSAKGRSGLHMNFYEDFIQTDAAINPGNSGGPLVTLDGKVIGINAAIKTRNGGFQGVGLAVASNLANNVVKALRTEGVVHRGYLGIAIRDLDPDVAARLKVPQGKGVLVGEVTEGAPAAKGGVQAGDIITAISGKSIKDGKTLQGVVASAPLHKAIPVQVLRDGKAVTLQVTIEEQPKDFGTVALQPSERRSPKEAEVVPLEKLGIDIADLSEDSANNFGYREGAKGVVITNVQSGSLASQAGLRRGMLITKVDNEKVGTTAAARQKLEGANLSSGVLLQVQSPQGGINFVLLKEQG